MFSPWWEGRGNVWRTFSLFALLLGGCRDEAERRQNFNTAWDNVRQDSDIESLKRQVADLQKQDEFQDNELTALAQSEDELSNTVSRNGKIQNDNTNLAERRWDYIQQRLPH
jgi:hypothetical protein